MSHVDNKIQEPISTLEQDKVNLSQSNPSKERSLFITPEPNIKIQGTELTTEYTRYDDWVENAAYKMGNSLVRLFSGIAYPVDMRPGTDPEGAYAQAKAAGKWGLEQTRDLHACCYSKQHSFASSNSHLVITGFYNITTDEKGWAALFTREGGTYSAAYVNYTTSFVLRPGDFTLYWDIGSDRIRIVLHYADDNVGGLRWGWTGPGL